MIFGVDYYPEHWPKAEWPAQARQMRELGCNTARVAEFAWSRLEPREGEFDFGWLDEAIETLAREGVKVILGTPTAAPPRWLVNRYDVLQRDKYGRPRPWGSRRECCANNPDYIEKSRVIVEAMAAHYAGNPNVIGWQIDNEFGCHGSTRCFCAHCRRAFAAELKAQYGSIEALNEAWGTVFWSLDYTSFDDIGLPGYNSAQSPTGDAPVQNPSLEMAFRQFASRSWVRYQQMQIDILRRYSSLPITHNLMGHFSDIDYYALAKDLDYVSWDNYPDNQWGSSEYQYVAMAHETMRGVKGQNFIVMEEQAGPAGWDKLGATPAPGQLRLWSWQAVGHGAEGMIYFRFRTALVGTEQYWFGVLDHDGVPRRRFYELQKTGQELQKLERYLVGTRPHYDALLVKSYDDGWAHEIKSHREGFRYGDLLYACYKAALDAGIATAVGPLSAPLERYKMVLLPAHNIVTDGEAERLRAYAEAGGTLVLTFRSGLRDEHNNVRPLPAPGIFAGLAGVEAPEFDAPRAPVAVDGLDGALRGTARLWCDLVEPQDAKVLARYASGWYAGKAAVTVRHVGRGRVAYLGCDLDDNALRVLLGRIAQDGGLMPEPQPAGVELLRREDAAGHCVCRILLNHGGEPVTVPGVEGVSLLSGDAFSGKLPAYGVEVLA